jgi:hypothetical protein
MNPTGESAMRASAPVLLFLMLLAAARGAIRAQEADTAPPPDDPNTAALAAMLRSERVLLEEALEQYRAAARQRPDAIARLVQVHEALEAEVGRQTEAVPGRIDQLAEIAAQATADFEIRLGAERAAAARVRTHLRSIALLERELADLAGKKRPPAETGPLTGTWDLVLMPYEQKGSWVLQQSGAIVSGTYRLQGGYSGSVQGTLVERKLYLVRIDSRLGKMMELEGQLSTDASTIRGTWLNYELAGSEGATGNWVATRRATAP